jgi:hypothetical protein
MFPVTFFDIEKTLTMWDQLRGIDNKKLSKEEINQKIQCMKLICEKAVVYWPSKLTANDFFSVNIDEKIVAISWKLYTSILAHNFPTLKKCYSVKKENVVHIAELCREFGKKPHEHIKASGSLSDLESYMIDEFFYSQLLSKKNSQIERDNAIRSKNKVKK